MLYAPDLVTLTAVKQHRKMPDTTVKDDDLLTRLIHGASAAFQQAIERVCVPYYATHLFDYARSYALDVGKAGFDLLAITTLTNGDTSTISGSGIVLRTSNVYPKWRIELKQSASNAFTYSGDWQEAISVAGWWGYVPNYPTCWRDTAVDVPGGGITSNSTSMTLSEANAALFEIGSYIKSDDEIMQVTARDNTSITFTRGELGTTAASHSAGAAINVFRVQADISDAVREMVVYAYKAKDRIGGAVKVFDGGMVQVEEMDRSVADAINRHQRKFLMVVK